MAITQLGRIGSGTATSAGTTLAIVNTTGAVIPAGTLIQVSGAWDNVSATAPALSCSTIGGASAGTAIHSTGQSGITSSAGAGIFHQCWRAVTVSDIASGATIATLTSNQSAVKRAGVAFGFAGATATMRNAAATTGSNTGGALTIVTPGTLPVQGDVVVFIGAWENNAIGGADTDTTGGSWSSPLGINTTGGSANTNVAIGGFSKVVTAGGAQSATSNASNDSTGCIVTYIPEPVTHTAAVTINVVSTLVVQGKLPNEPRYYETFWDTVGSPVDTNQSSKDIVDIPVTSGALIIAVGIGMRDDGGTQDIATMLGATTSAWTKLEPAFTDGNDPAVIGGWATATSTGLLDVRVYVGTDAVTERPMGVAIWVLDPGQWSGTPTWSPSFGFQSDTNGTVPVNPAAGAYVFYAGSDPNNGLVASLPTPSDGTVHHSEDLLGPYSVWLASWMNVTASTFGPDSLSGYDITGVSIWVQKASSGPVTHTGAVTFVVTSAQSNASTAFKLVSASVTTPVISGYTASGGAVLQASVTTTVSSGYSASGVKALVASSTTPVVSTQSASATAFAIRPASVTTLVVSAVGTSATAFKRVIASVNTPVVSTYAASAGAALSASVTIPVVSTISNAATAFAVRPTAVTTPVVSAYSAEGDIPGGGSVTHEAEVVFNVNSDYTTAAHCGWPTAWPSTDTPWCTIGLPVVIKFGAVITPVVSTVNATTSTVARIAAVTTPIASQYNASGNGRFNASSSTPVISALIAQGNKMAFGSTTTPVVSTTTTAGTRITQAASSTSVISTVTPANGTVIPGPGSVTFAVVSTTPAPNATRVVMASVTFAVTSGMTVAAPKGIFAGASITPVVSTTPAPTATRIAVAASSIPVVSTYAVSGVGRFQAAVSIPVISTYAASGVSPGQSAVTTPVVSTYSANGFVIRQAAVTIPIISTMGANATAIFMASSTMPVVSTTVTSGVRAAVASGTTPVTSTYVANGRGVFMGSTTTPVISTYASAYLTPQIGGAEFTLLSTYNADGFVIRRASVVTPIVSTTITSAIKVTPAAVTTVLTTTYTGSGFKQVSASSTTAVISTVVTQGNGIFRASSITSIVSDMMVAGSLITFGEVVTEVVSTFSSYFAIEDLIKRLHPTVLVELTWANELKELTTTMDLVELSGHTKLVDQTSPNKLVELTGASTLKDVVI